MNITRTHPSENAQILANTGLGEQIAAQPPECATLCIAAGQTRSYVAVAYPLKQGETERLVDLWLLYGTKQERSLAVSTIQSMASKIFGKITDMQPVQELPEITLQVKPAAESDIPREEYEE